MIKNYWEDLEPLRSRRRRCRRVEAIGASAVIVVMAWTGSVIVTAVSVTLVLGTGWLDDESGELLGNLIVAVFYGTPAFFIATMFRALATAWLNHLSAKR